MNYTHKYLEDFPSLKFLLLYLEGHNGAICGGCFKNIFRKEEVKDIDIFFRTQEDFDKGFKKFSSSPDYNPVYENSNAASFLNKVTGVRIELIKKIYGSPNEIIEMFDFSVCRFAFYWDKDEFIPTPKAIYADNFFEDLQIGKLNLDNKILHPVDTFERAFRYYGYGFKMDRQSKSALVLAIKMCEELGDLSDENYFGR